MSSFLYSPKKVLRALSKIILFSGGELVLVSTNFAISTCEELTKLITGFENSENSISNFKVDDGISWAETLRKTNKKLLVLGINETDLFEESIFNSISRYPKS